MIQALAPLATAVVTALMHKHKRESNDTGAAVTTQLATLPALVGSGVIASTEFGSDADALIALASVLVTVGLHFYRTKVGR